METTTWSAFGQPATAALGAAIAMAKEGDPLAPVTVIVPSNYAGLSLRRALGPAGVVNVRSMVLARLAELLGGPALAGRRLRPLTAWRQWEAIAAALNEAPGILAGVSAHASTVESLRSTFRDLRGIPAKNLDEVATAGPRAADVVRLFRRVREMTEGTYYDAADLVEAAAAGVEAGSAALADIGTVINFLPRELTPPESRLVAALGRRGPVETILGRPEEDVARALADEPANRPTTRIVSAGDAEQEVRQIIRMALAEARAGTPFRRMAVFFPDRAGYARLVHELCEAAGVCHNGPAVGSLAQSMPGRTLLSALRLREGGLRRDQVMEWLTAAPIVSVPAAEGRDTLAPAADWDEISREAGVVRGAGQWEERLERYSARLRPRVAAGTDPAAPHPGSGRREREVRALQRFVRELDRALTPAGHQDIAALARWATALLERYLGGPTTRGEWPADEQAAYDRIIDQLQAMSEQTPVHSAVANAVNGAGHGASLQRQFLQGLEMQLAAASAPVGRFGEGIFCGPLSAARGMEFDLVFLPGMAEGIVPSAGREDPLLPEVERATGGPMRKRAMQRDVERRDYLAAIGCAPSRVMLFPRADLAGESGNLPSTWILEAAGKLAGKTLSSAEFGSLRERAWLITLPSFEAGLIEEAEPATQQEYAIRSLLRAGDELRNHHLLAADAELRLGFDAAAARFAPWRLRAGTRPATLTRWDGAVGVDQSLAPSVGRPTSPTTLETFASCGFKYFLDAVLRVRETKLPEDEVRITPAERGNIIHGSLEDFFIRFGPGKAPGESWTSDERNALLQIGGRWCDDAEASGLTGGAVLWRVDRARILRDLALFLDHDEQWRAERQVRFAGAESPFGADQFDTGPSQAVRVELANGGAVAFRGRFDRVDRGPGSELVVYDYKSGRSTEYRRIAKEAGDRTAGGKQLQLPVYALAARQQFAGGMPVPTEALYWFVSEEEKFAAFGFQVRDDDISQLSTVLSVMVETMSQGLFAADPGKRTSRGYEHCRHCPYDDVCPAAGRDIAWAARANDQRLAALVALSPADNGRNGSDGEEDRADE